MQPLSEVYQGRWRGIVEALGIPSSSLDGNNKPCPICGGRDRFNWKEEAGKAVYFCRHCGGGDAVTLLEKYLGLEFKQLVSEIKRVAGEVKTSTIVDKIKPDAKQVNSLLRGASTIKGTLVEKYLLNRKCLLPEYDVFYQSKGWGISEDRKIIKEVPCMIALAKDKNGNLKGVSKTFLNPDGTKHKLDKQITKIKGLDFTECTVRLFDVKQTMGIAEGIETALSATKLYGIPTWASINRVLLEQFQVPDNVKCITVFSDNDVNFSGQLSAFKLADRLYKEGFNVNVVIPELNDFNDVLQAAS